VACAQQQVDVRIVRRQDREVAIITPKLDFDVGVDDRMDGWNAANDRVVLADKRLEVLVAACLWISSFQTSEKFASIGANEFRIGKFALARRASFSALTTATNAFFFSNVY
jgi:hypothetical protein